MAHTPAQHALREMRAIFTSSIAQIILVAVVVLLGLSGPFGTFESLSFGPRLAYWAITVPVTFGVGVLVSAFVAQAMRDAHSAWAVRLAVACATAIFVGITVVILNLLAFGPTSIDLPSMLPVMATAGVIAVVFHAMANERANLGASKEPEGKVALMDRLELNKRGALISLTVQDHYVEVTTTAGSSLLLMRLADAIREASAVNGLQIHRSHWVALDHVRAARREGDKAILTLSDSRELPASRSNIKALKDAGILPR